MPILPKAAALVAIGADPTGLERGVRKSESTLARFARGVGGVFKRGIGGIGSFLARSLDPLGRAWDLIASQFDEVQQFERGVARMAIAQGKSNDEMAAFRDEIRSISEDTGIARTQVLAGAQAYQALTGDTKGANAAMRTFARISQATGGSVDDIATSAAALSQNLKIDPADFEKAFDILNYQGKAGAIELRDMAGELSTLAAGFQRFKGGTGTGGMQVMGAALQIIRRNFGSASEAATGFDSLMSAIIKNAKKLEKAGVKVFDKDPKTGKKTLKDFNTIVTNIGNSKLMKDPTKLSKALGRVEAERALAALMTYRSEFDELATTQAGAGSIEKDRAQYAESAAGQLEASMNRLKLAAAEAFTPERIEAFAAAMGNLANMVSQVSDGLGKVFDTMGDIIGISTGKQKQLGGDNYLVSARDAAKRAQLQGQRPSRGYDEMTGSWDALTKGQYNVGRAGAVAKEYRSLELESERKARDARGGRTRSMAYVGTPGQAAARSVFGDVKAAIERAKPPTIKLTVDGKELATSTANSQAHRVNP